MRGALFLLLMALLSGCAAGRPAPVSDQTQSQRQPESEFREVLAGDTLYSIAWESGRDFRELAAWNGIASPYTIHPGQKLRLFPPDGKEPEKAQTDDGAEAPEPAGDKADGAIHVVAKGETLYGIARKTGVDQRKLAAWNNLSAPYALKPGQKLRLTPSASGGTAPVKPAIAKKGSPTAGKPAKSHASGKSAAPATGKPPKPMSGSWSWPAHGALLERYRPNAALKGIDIGGNKGQPISAAAEGQVVYQGSGLRGYGQLIILKHSADYLSAYAHCDRIYVKEGDVVKRGQKIADMGASGTDRVKLHFEIRYRGTPVNPLEHLPRK
jgi:lipoprotein NlpD